MEQTAVVTAISYVGHDHGSWAIDDLTYVSKHRQTVMTESKDAYYTCELQFSVEIRA